MPVVISGMHEINRVYETFKLSAANRIVKPALNKAAQRGAKIVKQSIPSRYKEVRKAIGWRSVRYSNTSKRVGAKVGAAVGKRDVATTETIRSGRKGVGFGVPNIHWWFLGTAERMTGTKRARRGGKRGRGGWKGTEVRIDTGQTKRRTGRMKPQSRPIAELLSNHKKELATIIRVHMSIHLRREIKRSLRTR